MCEKNNFHLPKSLNSVSGHFEIQGLPLGSSAISGSVQTGQVVYPWVFLSMFNEDKIDHFIRL